MDIKLFMLAGVGPVIATIIAEDSEKISVKNAAQFGQDPATNELIIVDYLDTLIYNDKITYIYKSNIVSVSEPVSIFAEEYKKAVSDNVIIAPKEQKIFLG